LTRGQVHGARKERRITRTRIIIIIIIIRNGAKTISLQTLFGRLNNVRGGVKYSINNHFPIKVYYRICTVRHVRIKIIHGIQNVLSFSMG
jgi:hypothetical protein